MAKTLKEVDLLIKTEERRQKLLGKGHSPAGAKYAAKEEAAGRTWGKPKRKGKPKKKGEAVYFKGIRRPSMKEQLKGGGLTDKELKSLGIK